MPTEQELHALHALAEERIKTYGKGAQLKVHATLVRAVIEDLGATKQRLTQAAAPLDRDESAAVQEMRAERDAAVSTRRTAETELKLLRAVVEAAEEKGRKALAGALAAYRAQYPAATGNTSANVDAE